MTSEISVHGFTDDAYDGARRVFEENLATGRDVGASFCVTVEGDIVVDLWGGFADHGQSRPWLQDTIVGVYSTTKTVTALTALLLADHGELDFDVPVARYWPEFAANGKEHVTVAQVMSHSSGLSGWEMPITAEDLLDGEKVTTLLAAQAPFWEPGTASGYHAITQGYLVGEVVRRITGQTVGTVFREQLAEPLGIDFHIGLAACSLASERALPMPRGGMPQGADATGRRARPRPRHTDPVRARFRHRYGHAQRQHAVLGRLRWLTGDHRSRRGHDAGLHHEQDDRHHHRGTSALLAWRSLPGKRWPPDPTSGAGLWPGQRAVRTCCEISAAGPRNHAGSIRPPTSSGTRMRPARPGPLLVRSWPILARRTGDESPRHPGRRGRGWRG
ncbi:beta-lactamase family protein [Phytoactinopolyspora alkaliphila]|uniref:Beta-lactamase family protein n=1 Tax=Phytoactinopolyspora alkaliphila TaxID=1783498 RepID=A0A6N9YS90_9ACTN|nr:beta-lactamase family protein [Phytoactinopolyspora alkaliphila]